MEAIREGKSLRSRRYRNRRLGEFLKELDLTEGRATGIPTVQEELEANGSPRATIETDEERTYFLIDIPCHPYFAKKEIEINTNGVKEDAESGVKDGVKDGVKELSDIQEIIVKEMLFAQFRCLHIPFKGKFKADLYASATFVADPKVVHRLGVTLVSLLTIAVCLVSFLGHSHFS